MQDEVEARDWSGVDGATAWHLIDRHANNWTDVGEMMNAWLASNSSAALRQRPVVDDARMARALEWVRVMAMQDANGSHLPAIEEAIAAYDPNCGGRTVRVVDDATRKNAERYEWLRNKAIHTETPEDQETCWAVVGTCADDSYPVDGQDLDELVDDALLAASQQDTGGK